MDPKLLDLLNQWLGGFHNLLAAGERGALYGLGLDNTFKYAAKRPGELGYTDDHRGQGDALRHILLAAELQRQHPYLAKPLLYGHEYITNMLQGQPAEEREQDVNNNDIGLQLGQLASTMGWDRPKVEQMALTGLPKAKTLPPVSYPY